MLWLLEPDIFGAGHPLERAVLGGGHNLVMHRSPRSWLRSSFVRGPVLFHGSLNEAQAIREVPGPTPGAFCDAQAFRFSSWLTFASSVMLNDRVVRSTVAEVITDPMRAANILGTANAFIRPDSPFKEFSGRVIDLSVGPVDLDVGFYYSDTTLPVVLAPVKSIEREWRLVMVGREPIAWSEYRHNEGVRWGRVPDEVRTFATRAAMMLPIVDPVYVMDVCSSAGDLKLVELNPFSGADPYGCDPAVIVDAVSRVASDLHRVAKVD
jgi:hypothetical protein